MLTLTYFNIRKLRFCHSENEISTIVYHLIESCMGYKMMLNHRGKYVVLKMLSKSHHLQTMKNSGILKLGLYDI